MVLGTPLRAAIVSVLLAAGWQTAYVGRKYGGNPSILFLQGDVFPPPPQIRGGVIILDKSGGYDGQFYRMMAHDPFLRRGFDAFIDAPGFRCRRILHPLLAWTLGLGQDQWIDWAYFAVALVALGFGVWAAARWLADAGRSPCWALAVGLLVATLATLLRMTVDLLSLGLFAGFLWYARSRNDRGVWWTLAALALTRETGLFCVAGVTAWQLWRRQMAKAVVWGCAGAPALAWFAYVALVTRPGGGGQLFERPVSGPFLALAERWRGTDTFYFTEWISLVAYVASLVLAVWWLWRRRPWGMAEAAVAPMLAFLWLLGAPYYFDESIGYARAASPILLALYLWALEKKWWPLAVPPLLVSTNVALGYYRLLREILLS